MGGSGRLENRKTGYFAGFNDVSLNVTDMSKSLRSSLQKPVITCKSSFPPVFRSKSDFERPRKPWLSGAVARFDPALLSHIRQPAERLRRAVLHSRTRNCDSYSLANPKSLPASRLVIASSEIAGAPVIQGPDRHDVGFIFFLAEVILPSTRGVAQPG